MWNLKVLFFSAIPSVVSTQAAAQLVGTEPASCSKWREVNSGPKLDYVSTKRNNEARPVNIEPAPALCSKQREVDPGANIGYISTDVSHHIVGQPVNTEPVPTSSSKRRSDLGEDYYLDYLLSLELRDSTVRCGLRISASWLPQKNRRMRKK